MEKIGCKFMRKGIGIVAAVVVCILVFTSTALFYFSQPVWSLVCLAMAMVLQVGRLIVHIWCNRKRHDNSEYRLHAIVLNAFWLILMLDTFFRTLRHVI